MKYDFDGIRKHYLETTPRIMQAYRQRKDRWVSPYSCEVEWVRMFSPIEGDMWQSLRCYGHSPMYPQYPAGGYFLDFGHPGPKIGIECDGREWHQDKEKDARRDATLEKLGWTIFRIIGSDCARIVDLSLLEYPLEMFAYENMSILKDHYARTSEGLVEAIGVFYFGQTAFRHAEEIELAYHSLLSHATTGTDFIDEEYFRVKQRHYDIQEGY